jgi:hypothetical protein
MIISNDCWVSINLNELVKERMKFLKIDMTEDEIDETANELRTRMTFDSLFEQTDMMIWEISDSYGSLYEMVELVSPSWTIEIPRRIR